MVTYYLATYSNRAGGSFAFQHSRQRAYTFEIHRDDMGFIKTIDAVPKEPEQQE